jgi:hypothetical protein
MSKEFKVGDRVRVAKQSTINLDKDAVKGDTGTVVTVSTWNTILVEFDQAREQYSSGGSNKLKNGYWCHVDTLEHINTDHAATEKIIITTDGKTTTARRYKGKELLGSAEAVCSPSDPFDFERGAVIAFARLTDCDYVLSDNKQAAKREPKFKEGDTVRVVGRTYWHSLTFGSLANVRGARKDVDGHFDYDCWGVSAHGAVDQTVHENDLEKYDMPKGE